jgi:hypothetical protein
MKKEKLTSTFYLITLVLFMAKLWLLSAHLLLATSTPHDDLLFARQAMDIAGGHWLGEYDQMTLIKGPFYPLFIAIAYWLAIPVMTAQQLLYFGAVLTFVCAIFPAVQNRKIGMAIFVFLLMNPFTYFYDGTGRLFRLNIYPTLGLLTLACLCGLIIRDGTSLKTRLAWAAGAGLAFGCFWHTREESIWLVPSVLLIVLYHVYRSVREGGWQNLGSLAVVYLAPALIFSFVTLGFYSLNYRHYGLFTTVEIETPPFTSAYGGLLRIKSDKWRQYFPVVKDAREKAYAVSPSFKELEPYLEGELGDGWRNLAGADDLPAAFFIWVFRDSVAKTGHYSSSKEAMSFYSQIGRDIDAACEDGRLDCYPRVSNLVPHWHAEYNKFFFPILWKTLKRIVRFNECSATTEGIYSRASAEEVVLFQAVSHETIRTSVPKVWNKYAPPYHLHLNQEKVKILNDAGRYYSYIVPSLFLLGMAGLVCSLLLSLARKTMPSWAAVFSLSTLGGILSLGVILTLVEITSYSEITRAMQASYPMVLFFIVASMYEGVRLILHRGDRDDDPGSWE